MAWQAIVGAAAGGVLSGLISARGERDTNELSAEEAQRNRDFQERMSNTAVQRRMADMRAAGINPLLAARHEASTPSGSMAAFGNPGAAFAEGFQRVAGTALQATRQPAEIARLEAETAKLEQEVENLKATYQLTEEQTENVRQLTLQAWERTNNLKKEGQRIDYQNIANAIITEFKQEHPSLTVLQSFGVDGGTLSDFLKSAVQGATRR